MKRFLFSLLAFASISIYAQDITNPNLILGEWIPKEGKSHVKIEKIGNKYFGKVIWLKEPLDKETGKPPLDKKNPDESMRNQPIMGLRIMKDFVYIGE
ncbi:MAG: DUF2147 domain-containing protein, partial [Flavobacteriales bacterium]|nr:DUF2147 domain-containing protein [Flavobacteriales bacterium]